MKKTARFLCILCALLSMMVFNCLEAYAASISVSVSLSGHSCKYTVQNSESYTVWAQLEDDSGNIVVDYYDCFWYGIVTLTPPGEGRFRYVITAVDNETGDKAYGYSGYFTIEACEHSRTKKVNIVYTYKTLSSTEHMCEMVYDLCCRDCDAIVQEWLYDEWEEEHEFKDGVCVYCNYGQEACKHQNRSPLYYDPEYVNTGDVDYHSVVTTYKVFCDDCGKLVDWGKEEEFEFHEYDHDGLCFCGYYNEDYCPHDNTERRDAGYAYGVDGSINNAQHFVEHFYEGYCLDCNQVIGHGAADSGEHNPWWEGYWENHIFDANGICVCGYETQVCAHVNTDRRDGAISYIMDASNAAQHRVDQAYEIYCLECGQVIAAATKEDMEEHHFSAEGYCVCGFYKDLAAPPQPLQVVINDWYTEATVGMSIGATAKISGGSGEYTCHWSASSNQHKHVQASSDNWSWGITPASEGTWTIKITVHDKNTGEKVSATTHAIHVITVRDKYLDLLRQYTKWENPLKNRQIYDLVWQRLYPHFGAERTRELIQIVSEAPADYRTLYLYTLYDYDIFTTNLKGWGVVAYYDDITNGISFRESDLQNEEVLFHEMGHAVDNVVYWTMKKAQTYGFAVSYNQLPEDSCYLRDLVLDDVKNDIMARIIDSELSENSARRIAQAIIDQHDDELTEMEKEEMKRVPLYYDQDNKIAEQLGALKRYVNHPYENISDVYGGATGNYILGYHPINGSGHTDWAHPSRLPLEFWAHYFSARLRNDKDELLAFYGMLPQASKKMDETVERLADMLIAGE